MLLILGTSVATMQTSPTYPDNSNKLATTSFVTSAISNNNNLSFRGYIYMLNQSTNLIGNLNINFTNGSTLKFDDTFTIRFSIRYDYNTASQGQSIYYNSYYGNLMVFQNRVITNNGTYQAYLNGALNTNTTYS